MAQVKLFYIVVLAYGLFLVGFLAHRLAWLPFKPAFGMFALGLLLSVVMVIVSVVVLLLALVGSGHGDILRPLILLVVSSVPIVAVLSIVGGAGFKAPKIHDISTNLSDPLLFVHGQSLRKTGENTLSLPEEAVKSQQREAYPQLGTLLVSGGVSETYRAALSHAKSLGWDVVYENVEGGMFEAVETTRFLNFSDDIAVRVRSSADSADMSEVDVRSVSRVGVSDLGANAARIQKFFAEFQASR